MKKLLCYAYCLVAIWGFSCTSDINGVQAKVSSSEQHQVSNVALFTTTLDTQSFAAQLNNAALQIINPNIQYVPDYVVLDYPNGDVPAHTGVCTDVVIRAYRKLGIDLQQLVHEDMRKNFAQYPANWGRKHPDKNIDHRRVPNLMKFFERNGSSLPISDKGTDYEPGDIVTWVLANGLTHIGIVVNSASADGKRPLIVHNIGNGQIAEDCLFKFTITGHYRYEKARVL